MAIRSKLEQKTSTYFITFTCYNWLPLFELIDGYEIMYRQFDQLKVHGHEIISYVIMPNHLHTIIFFRKSAQSINLIIGNFKRFAAYEIIRKLKNKGSHEILEKLSAGVNLTDAKRGKLHEVFEPSFDAKEILKVNFLLQKLIYIHENPIRGKWKLAKNPESYIHSSAKYYFTGEQGIYKVMDYESLKIFED